MMPHMPRGNSRNALVAIAAIAALALVGGCGGSDEPASNSTDTAFVEAMIPHHAMAVESAQGEYENGNDKQTRGYAQDIVNTQMAEITEMNSVGKQIGANVDPAYTAPLNRKKADAVYNVDATTESALKALGFKPQQVGMSDDMKGATNAEFVDLMVANLEGGIRIARVEVEKGSNATLQKLARGIISTQSQQVGELKQSGQ